MNLRNFILDFREVVELRKSIFSFGLEGERL